MTISLAVAFGFRSTFAVLIFPLWLYAARRHPWWRIVGGILLLVLSALAWTWLVASLSGGWSAYRDTSGRFFSEVVVATKLLGGGIAKIPAQATAIGASALLGLGLFLLPLFTGLYGSAIGRPPFPSGGPFLAAWAGPMVLFHIAYDWAPRFGVLLMPPLAILAAASAVPLARWLLGERATTVIPAPPPGPLPRALVILALAVNLGLFLLPVRIGPLTLPEPYPSGPRLLARNEDLARRDAAIRAYDPETTLVLAYDHTFHVSYFLPEYRVVGLFPLFKQAADSWVPSARRRVFSFEPGSEAIPAVNPLPLPRQVSHIVLYDPDYRPLWPVDQLPLDPLPYDVGRELGTAAVPGPGCLQFGYRSLQFLPAGKGGCPGAVATIGSLPSSP
jgi:hypothetical protein